MDPDTVPQYATAAFARRPKITVQFIGMTTDADFLHEAIGYTAQRPMDAEVEENAKPSTPTPQPGSPRAPHHEPRPPQLRYQRQHRHPGL